MLKKGHQGPGGAEGKGRGPHVWAIHTLIITIIIIVISFKFPATEMGKTYVVLILPMRKLRWREEWLVWGDLSGRGLPRWH